MKILTKKQKDEILLCIVANEIIAAQSIDDIEVWKQHIENAHEMAMIIGGIDGALKVIRSIEKYMETNSNE